MIVAGIDPGATGAIALIDLDLRLLDLFDMPYAGQVDVIDLAARLSVYCGQGIVRAFIEDVHSMPGQGVATMFKMGQNYGAVLGVCGAIHLPVTKVTPLTWKRALNVKGKGVEGKRAAVALARQTWPDGPFPISKHGRADAALIAMYGAHHYLRGEQLQLELS